MEIKELEVRLRLLPGQISTFLGVSKASRYREKELPARRNSWKRNARLKVRSVWRPCVELKLIQRQIHRLIDARFEPHPIAHSYVRGRGIVTNARQHVGKEWLFHLDLVNFFGSITEKAVIQALQRLLPDFSDEEIAMIADLCCHDDFLPQGAPSSPILSNVICSSLDERLEGLARFLGCTVTRYSDDICFSSHNTLLPIELGAARGRGAAQQVEVGRALRTLIERDGLEINAGKLRFQTRTERQQVTGLIVNDRVNVPKECYRKVRDSLHLWKGYGIDAASSQSHRRAPAKRFANSLKGLIDYVGQVTGTDNRHYQSFLMSFDVLRNRDLASSQIG